MKKDNLIKNKSFDFAIRIVNLSKLIAQREKEFIISKQLIRSGTSIGALIREAEHAESRADFIHKLSISLKEANETEYWIDILFKTNYISIQEYESIQADIKEILKLLISILKKLKEKRD